MKAEPEYTNGRLRLRPEQADYLDDLLHKTWIEVSRLRAQVKDAQADNDQNMIEPSLITHMNRELRLIKSLQDELRRAMEDMGLA